MKQSHRLFTNDQLRAFRTMRSRYDEDHDCLTLTELARVRFFRWLRETGRIDTCPDESEVDEASMVTTKTDDSAHGVVTTNTDDSAHGVAA